jgi:hypothetical protein
MSLHDDYARTTPYELVFQSRAKAEAFVSQVEEESSGRGADAEDPHAFVTMGAVGDFVRGLQGPDAQPGSVHQYGALAFHGLHFTRADCPLFLLSTHVARYLVEGVPGSVTDPPTPAGYLQLPQHLFWADGGGDAPESVDGIFWTVTKRGVLHTLIVSGMRPDRPGLVVVPLPEAPIAEASQWIDAQPREELVDFATLMPGAELDHLYSFSTAGEVLKLLSRFFAYADAVPNGLTESVPGSADPESPEASRLSFVRVALDG